MEKKVNELQSDGLLLTKSMNIDLKERDPHDDLDIDSCEMEDGGLDTKRSLPSDLDSLSMDDCFNDEGPPIDDFDDDDPDGIKYAQREGDEVLDEIKLSIARRQSAPKSDASSTASSDGSPHVKVSNQFLSIPHGLIPRATYEHSKRNTDIMGVTYNARMRQFIILDSKGITAWKRDAVEHRVSRALAYPKYEYRLITNVVYAKKYNCYFVLGKDFSLKVYNRDFYETCSVSADLRSVLFMLFNPVRDELITGGVGGTKVWRFHQQAGKSFGMLRPLSNYGLTLKYELPNVGGSWVKRVELDHHLEHLYCCSDTDLHVYDLSGKLLFKFERAHMMSITGCRYSRNASVLVTSSIDCEVKVWSLLGGLVHTFRGHSRAVTNLTLHPATSSIVITCSLDGTVRMWSLDTMECIYSLVVSVDGVQWMGLTDDNLLYLSTPRAVTLWNMNYSVQFWALARSRVTRMVLCGCKEKTTRLMAISEDSSVRLMARSNSKNLTTVLPPPSISPLQRVLSVCYNREFNAIYMLINPHEIWVYTTRTDPACRIAVWDVIDIQDTFVAMRHGAAAAEEFNPASISVNKTAPTHRATENGAGNEVLANCCCISILNSTAMVWTDEGCCCPIRDSYLLLGLEDGRILFMDPVIKGHKYLEFKTGKDPVLDMYHDVAHKDLITLYKLKDMIQIHVWSLPDLELQHEVYIAPDLRDYARVGYTLVTGHESGCVIFHPLELATDPGLHKAKMVPAYADVIDVKRKPEHFAPVITVDACVSLKIFCSCSNDGAIKIWTDDNMLLTEIMLDSTLSSACFLNNQGDLLVGYQKHVFYIDHTKVCPQLTVPESDVDSFDKESYICEDPAVLYEGVTPNPDPVTLENYLVPFDIEFSKDFLEGKVKLEPEITKQEESDDESQVSMAPTEIYRSPDSTPRRRLSLVDLTLGSDVSRYDLLKHMKKTLDHLAEKAKRDAAQIAYEERRKEETKSAAYLRKRQRLRRRGELIDESDGEMLNEKANNDEKDGADEEEDDFRFEFPRFGKSPGPTPQSTPPTTPEVLSGDESEGLDVTQEEVDVSMKVQVVQVVKKEPDDEISQFLKSQEEKGKKSGSTESLGPKRKFGFSDIKVDAQTLIKDAKKTSQGAPKRRPPPGEEAQKGKESDSDAGEHKSGRREKPSKKKMMSSSQRKHSKFKKSDKMDSDKIDPREAPPTQMQALEQREQKLNTARKSSQEMSDKLHSAAGINEAESSLKIEREYERRKDAYSPSVDKKDKSDQNIGVTSKVSVPSLPVVPVAQSNKSDMPRPSTSKPKSTTSAKAGGRSAIDFGPSESKKSLMKDESAVKTKGEDVVDEGRSTEGSGTDPVVVSETINQGDASVVSAASEDARAAFRIGLLSKEVEDANGIEDGRSPSIAAKKSKAPSSIATEKSEPNVRECRRDSAVQKENVEKTKKETQAKKSAGKAASKSSQQKERKMSPKAGRKSSAGSKTAEKANVPKPEDLLDAYFEKQKEKAAKKDAPRVFSPSKAEEMLRLASSGFGKQRPVTPETENRTESSTSNSDPRSFMVGGVTSTPIQSIRATSPDASMLRAVTPSLSIIENESVRSVSPSLSVTRGLGSPLPVVREDSFASSPLPTVDEVIDQSSSTVTPHEKENQKLETGKGIDKAKTPVPEEIGVTSNVIKEDDKSQMKIDTPLVLEQTQNELPGDIKKVPSGITPAVGTDERSTVSSPSVADDKRITITSESPVLKVTISKHYPRSSQDSDLSIISKSATTASESGSGGLVPDTGGREDSSESETQIQSFDTTIERSTPSVQRESPQDKQLNAGEPKGVVKEATNTSSAKAETDGKKGLPMTATSHGKVDIMHQKSVEQAQRILEPAIIEETEDEGDEVSKAEEVDGVNKDMSVAQAADDDDFSEKSWNSDFDSNSPSIGSIGTSSLSVSDAFDDDDKRNGDASSSSNAEPLLQVKIRKKPWSHYRIKRQTSEDKSPRPEAQMKAALSLRRKFSQNDALTVQRNAYLESVKVKSKRAQSAVEGSNIHRGQLHRLDSWSREVKRSSAGSISQCVLCAAEGTEHHATHVKASPRSDVEKEKRRISFQDDVAPSALSNSSQKTTPRIEKVKQGFRESPQHEAVFQDGDSNPTDGTRSPTVSDTWATPRGKGQTPTPVPTPDPSYSRPSSQVFSEISNQPTTISPQTENLEEEETRYGSEALSEVAEDFDQSERLEGTPDSSLVAGGIISVSRTQLLPDAGLTEDLGPIEELGSMHLSESGVVDEAHIEDLLSASEMDRAKTRPMTSVEDKLLEKPELQSALKYFRQRPRTAEIRFRTEDLQTAFDTSLMKYKRLASTPLASDKIYKNDDQAFTENWHERQIERHMLIRMQKELRAQNAMKRRQMMEMKKQERWSQHHHPGDDYPQDRGIPGSHVTGGTYQRASTVHGSRPAQKAPAPTPESSRPHTATGVYDRPQPQAYLQHQHLQQHQQYRPPQRLHPTMTIQQQMKWTQQHKARQQEIEMCLREKSELGHEKPFRCRLRQQRESEVGEDQHSCELSSAIDPWLLDPRNPQAVRPKSSKSIPSKCHRYVLVTRPKTKLNVPLPSPLEEQLLASRFPEQGERVFRRYEGLLFRPPRRPYYGVDYSPYQHQLYG